MDGRRFIIAMFQSEKAPSITQVVMNLPNDAVDFLGLFYLTLENETHILSFTASKLRSRSGCSFENLAI